MKEIFIALLMLLLILLIPQFVKASEIEPVKDGFAITFPMETGAVGFWFPRDGTFAGGLSHTFMRIGHSDIPKVTVDFDGTIAQQINKDGNTLGGLGIKLNLNIKELEEKGFTFIPSLGVTALNDWTQYKTAKDILSHYEIAVYGTLVQYKW